MRGGLRIVGGVLFRLVPTGATYAYTGAFTIYICSRCLARWCLWVYWLCLPCDWWRYRYRWIPLLSIGCPLLSIWQLDHTYGSTGALYNIGSAFVTSASTGTNAGVAQGATGSVSISATYASIHVARSTAALYYKGATGYAIGNGNGYVSALLLYVGAAPGRIYWKYAGLGETGTGTAHATGPTGSHSMTGSTYGPTYSYTPVFASTAGY